MAVAQSFNIFLVFNKNRKSIKVFILGCQWPPSCFSWIQSSSSESISVRFNLILSFHLLLGLFRWKFPTKIACAFLISPRIRHIHSISIPLIWSCNIIFCNYICYKFAPEFVSYFVWVWKIFYKFLRSTQITHIWQMQIFGKKWDQIQGKFRTLHNEQFTDLYRSASWPVVRLVKYRWLRRAGYVLSRVS